MTAITSAGLSYHVLVPFITTRPKKLKWRLNKQSSSGSSMLNTQSTMQDISRQDLIKGRSEVCEWLDHVSSRS